MPIYNQSISNESGVFLLPADASRTTFVPGESPSVAAGIIRSRKGKPFTMLPVTAANFLDVLGTPYHPSESGGKKAAEPIRHLKEALSEAPAYVVRVVATDAMYPIVHFNPLDAIATAGLTYDSAPALGAVDTLLSLYLKDGDSGADRSILLTTSDPELSGDELFMIELFEGDGAAVETHVVSLDPMSTDDFGQSNYIETVLDSKSQALGVVLNGSTTFADLQGNYEVETPFTGGTDGSEPTVADYQKAALILGTAEQDYSDILAMGCYESAVLTDLASFANKRLCMFLFDDQPSTALAQLDKAAQFGGQRGLRYHFPYWATDPFTGQSFLWGLSGAAFAARARSFKQVTGILPGYHLSPAGVDRGRINRTSIKADGAGIDDAIENATDPTALSPLDYRINKVTVDATGNVFIDDAITCHPKNDYQRYAHVVSIVDAISRQFHAVANQLKHGPDGITRRGLQRLMTQLLDQFVTSGALVTPRNPERDGPDPYTLTIEQAEFDLWSVKWTVCPTGVARRLVGKPFLAQ